MSTPTPVDPHVAADKLLQAGVGSANLLLVALLYMVSQVYALTTQMADLQRESNTHNALIAAQEQRLQAVERFISTVERSP